MDVGRNENADARSGRSLVERPLDADERDKLLALRAATSEQAPLYVALLSVLAEAKTAYHLQLRTAEIRRRLDLFNTLFGDTALTERALRPALDQLRDWGCVDWVQDPSFRATSVEEYLQRHELWELTSVGEATLRAVVAVLGASEESGALQRAMFRQIRSSLDGLTEAVAGGDATAVYLRLRDLDLAIGELAANAREFYATINRIAREQRLDDHIFLLYKDQLIAYLQSFHDDLTRNRSVISSQLVALDEDHRARLVELAELGDDSRGLFGDRADWSTRWDGMLDWFISERTGRSDADALNGATTVAIRELLTLLRRLTEQAMRPVNRASELRETAAWFSRCETDAEAHELFDAAFGLAPTAHVGLPMPDPDSDGRFPSWWEVDPISVPVSLREYGKRASAGRTATRRDYSTTKQQLARLAASEAELYTDASRRLVSIDLRSSRIDPSSWPVLLSYLDQALAARPASREFATTIRSADAVIRLTSADHDTRLLAPAGTVTLARCRLEISAP